MFRPMLVVAAVVVAMGLASCADAPKRAPSTPMTNAPAQAGDRVNIPAAGDESDPTLGKGGSVAACRKSCDHSYAICSDSMSSPHDDMDSVVSKRMFGRTDVCGHELDECNKRCATLR